MDRRQRKQKRGGASSSTPAQRPLIDWMSAFQRTWDTVWMLAHFYSYDLRVDVEEMETRHWDHEWYRRAEWVVSFTTGRPIWHLSCLNTLARIVVLQVVGSHGYRRLARSAFHVLGRQVDVQLDCSTGLILPYGIELAEEAYAPPTVSQPTSISVGVQTDLPHPYLTSFLECAPIAPFRVGDLQSLGMPSGSENPMMEGELVPGLHPPYICQLCDKIRARLPSTDCLTYSDKIALFLVHRRRRSAQD